MNIDKAFKNIVGQENAKARLSSSLDSIDNGGIMENLLVGGQAGLGKSALMRAHSEALKERGFEVLYLEKAAELRKKGSCYDGWLQMIMDCPRYAIFFDEVQTLFKKTTIQTDSVVEYLMKVGDGGNRRKTVRVGEEMTCSFDPSNHVVFLGTNLEGDLTDAILDRYPRLALKEYDHDQLVAILQIMLGREDMKPACETTLANIAKCGRGTARPMEKIITQLRVAVGHSKSTINREDVTTALKLADMFPLGVESQEIQILQATKSTPMRDVVLSAVLPSVDSKTLKASKGYLIAQKLGVQLTSGFQATDKGVRYMTDIQKAGFKLPKIGEA